MFVSEHLVYLQLQKTGSGHVARLLATCVDGDQIGAHNRLALGRPPEGQRVVGSIRNPWDWYVSLWAYGCQGRGGFHARTTSRRPDHPEGWLRRCLSSVHELRTPSGPWRAVYRDADSPALFRRWLGMTLDPGRRFEVGEGYGLSPLSSFAGLMTYRYLRLYARHPGPLWFPGIRQPERLRAYDADQNVLDHVVRTETLEDDLLRVLHACGHDLDDACADRIRSTPRTNVSCHRPIADYYDAETIDLVADRERLLVDKYGYAGPGAR